MTHEEEFGIEYADIMIDDCGAKFEDSESDEVRGLFYEEYFGFHHMACMDGCDEAFLAFQSRFEERLKQCICGQPAMLDFDLCADCRTIAEDTGVPTKKEQPRRPYEALGEWTSRPCGTICDGGGKGVR